LRTHGNTRTRADRGGRTFHKGRGGAVERKPETERGKKNWTGAWTRNLREVPGLTEKNLTEKRGPEEKAQTGGGRHKKGRRA